jgi:hypothetical protein
MVKSQAQAVLKFEAISVTINENLPFEKNSENAFFPKNGCVNQRINSTIRKSHSRAFQWSCQ